MTDTVFELEPITGDIKGPGDDQAELLTFRGKKNRILLGKPRVSDYLDDLRAHGAEIPADFARLAAKGYSFVRVRPTISLLPDSGCLFTDVDFSVELSSGSGSERPIAYEVRPMQITEVVPAVHTEKMVQELGGEAGVAAGKLIAKVMRENAVEETKSLYLRSLYSYGANFYQAGWRLIATSANALQGNVSDLEIIAQAPTGVELFGRFRIAAQIAVQAAPDRWLTRSFGPFQDGAALDVRYSLIP